MKLASKQRDERNNQILGGDTTEFQSRGRDQDQSSPRALKGAHEAFKIHSTQTDSIIVDFELHACIIVVEFEELFFLSSSF